MVSAHQFYVFIRVEGKFPEVEHYKAHYKPLQMTSIIWVVLSDEWGYTSHQLNLQ